MADEHDDFTEQEWIYLGEELSRDKKVYSVWQRPEGTRSYFTKMKGSVVGGRYSIRASDSQADPNSLKYLGQIDDQERRLEIQANARIEATLIEQHRMERSDKRMDEFLEALAPLQALMSKQIGHRRSAFVAMVITHLHAS